MSQSLQDFSNGLVEAVSNVGASVVQVDGRRRGSASGIIGSADGVIVTNNHVIEDADEISIEFFTGQKLDAKLVGTDPKTDIALLKVESTEPLPFVTFGNSDLMRVGDWGGCDGCFEQCEKGERDARFHDYIS